MWHSTLAGRGKSEMEWVVPILRSAGDSAGAFCFDVVVLSQLRDALNFFPQAEACPGHVPREESYVLAF